MFANILTLHKQENVQTLTYDKVEVKEILFAPISSTIRAHARVRVKQRIGI